MFTPRRMRWFNGASVVVWLVITVVQNFFDWAQSVAYVSNLSTWALVMSSLSSFLASRVEVVQAETDIPGDVVARIVTETDIVQPQWGVGEPE